MVLSVSFACVFLVKVFEFFHVAPSVVLHHVALEGFEGLLYVHAVHVCFHHTS
jgi:hypothetical protein